MDHIKWPLQSSIYYKWHVMMFNGTTKILSKPLRQNEESIVKCFVAHILITTDYSRKFLWQSWTLTRRACDTRVSIFPMICNIDVRPTYLVAVTIFQGNRYPRFDGDRLSSIQTSYRCTRSILMRKCPMPLFWLIQVYYSPVPKEGFLTKNLRRNHNSKLPLLGKQQCLVKVWVMQPDDSWYSPLFCSYH